MGTIPKTVGVISSAFILCVGLSYAYAAHPQAETRPSDVDVGGRRGIRKRSRETRHLRKAKTRRLMRQS